MKQLLKTVKNSKSNLKDNGYANLRMCKKINQNNVKVNNKINMMTILKLNLK